MKLFNYLGRIRTQRYLEGKRQVDRVPSAEQIIDEVGTSCDPGTIPENIYRASGLPQGADTKQIKLI
jgi:hypothetical protein